ncbi:MAG: class I SAM-dependent methyltransferase [Bryobacteraceae bacterium]
MACYDDFAWFYNRYWSEEFHSVAFPILERIWLHRLPPAAHILDVCCGTGSLAAQLTARGHRVTGLDISREMLAYARADAPAAEFFVADAASFHLPGVCDAAVSTFDSLNHLLEPAALEAAFRNIAAALRPGGLLAFDMLLEEAYSTRWGESFALVRADHLLTITGAAFDSRSRIARITVTMLRLLEAAWQRSDVTIEERCYSPAEISRALALAGFGEPLCYDAGDLGMTGQLGEGRTFFVATKLE